MSMRVNSTFKTLFGENLVFKTTAQYLMGPGLSSRKLCAAQNSQFGKTVSDQVKKDKQNTATKDP